MYLTSKPFTASFQFDYNPLFGTFSTGANFKEPTYHL